MKNPERASNLSPFSRFMIRPRLRRYKSVREIKTRGVDRGMRADFSQLARSERARERERDSWPIEISCAFLRACSRRKQIETKEGEGGVAFHAFSGNHFLRAGPDNNADFSRLEVHVVAMSLRRGVGVVRGG